MSDSAWFRLIDALKTATYDKFSRDFDVLDSCYASASGDCAIRVHILIPKSLSEVQREQQRPILVRIHGGYLVTGSSLYPPWFGDWVLQYASRTGAVIISPNYHLMPEATGTEILEDIDAFWAWLQHGGVDVALAKTGYESIRTDLEHIMVLGESAGGYLAMQLALSYPAEIQALVAAYPLLDPQSTFYTTEYSKPILGVANRPLSLVEQHGRTLESTPKHHVQDITEAEPPDRLELSFAIVQNGLYLQYLGQDNEKLFPMWRIESNTDANAMDSGRRLPAMFIFHGRDDSAVPYEGTTRFVDKLAKLRPLARCHLELQPGDHGFDSGASVDDTEWLKRGLNFVTPSWLKSTE